jgi:hypothetical protein
VAATSMRTSPPPAGAQEEGRGLRSDPARSIMRPAHEVAEEGSPDPS